MTKKADPIYYSTKTGDIVTVTKEQVKNLPPEFKKIKFTKNDKGEHIMRMNFPDENGNSVTVDISEATPEEAAAHDNKTTE